MVGRQGCGCGGLQRGGPLEGLGSSSWGQASPTSRTRQIQAAYLVFHYRGQPLETCASQGSNVQVRTAVTHSKCKCAVFRPSPGSYQKQAALRYYCHLVGVAKAWHPGRKAYCIASASGRSILRQKLVQICLTSSNVHRCQAQQCAQSLQR